MPESEKILEDILNNTLNQLNADIVLFKKKATVMKSELALSIERINYMLRECEKKVYRPRKLEELTPAKRGLELEFIIQRIGERIRLVNSIYNNLEEEEDED